MDSCAVFQLELFTFGLSNSLRARIRVSVEHCVYKDQEKGGWSGAKLGQSARNITSTPSLTHVNHIRKSFALELNVVHNTSDGSEANKPLNFT